MLGVSRFKMASFFLPVFVLSLSQVFSAPSDMDGTTPLNRITSASRLAVESIAKEAFLSPHFRDLLQSLIDNARPCQEAHKEPYSRVDGVCNNLRFPFQGAVLDYQTRMASNSYLDGKHYPRVLGRDGCPLPSARLVSNKCFQEVYNDLGPSDRSISQLFWQFGQYLTHDIVFSGLTQAKYQGQCCFEASNCDNCCYHPDLSAGSEGCFPLTIPANDPFYNDTCMEFTRSIGVNILGVREIVNGLTAFVDASNVYGASYKHSKLLRLGSRGLLKTENGTQLPRFGILPCVKPQGMSFCPNAGDSRVNTNPGLASLHTLYHIEHNRIAHGLATVNPFWDDETLFQVSRKILIGMWQFQVFEEYLPVLLGHRVMEMFHFNDDYHYNDVVIPSINLEFSTAAFRFGHSNVNSFVTEDVELSDRFFDPLQDSHYVDNILRSQANHTSMKTDLFVSKQIRSLLFKGLSVAEVGANSPFPGASFDLIARNIQRGRDHGIPPYTVVRDACRSLLHRLADIKPELPACLADGIYQCSEDIDLFVGGLAETPLLDSLLGPTFACVVAKQFYNLKTGDRFFYEGNGIEGFTYTQRRFLRQNTLAAMMCERNMDASLQRNVFRPVSESNPLVPCKIILQERGLYQGLTLWRQLPRQMINFRGGIYGGYRG